MRLNRVHFFAGFLVGLLVLLPLSALPAWAYPTEPECYTHSIDPNAGIFNTGGTDSAQAGNHTGIKSELWFGTFGGLSGSGDCIRVSSIGVLSGSGDGFVEVGWFLGWDTKAGNVYTGQGACKDGDYYGLPQSANPHPEMFVVWWPNGGSYHCKNLGDDGESIWHFMRIQDADLDTVWHYYEAGSDLGNLNLNWSRGKAYTNGERHNKAYDSAYSQFRYLQKNVAGLGSTLYDFTTSVERTMVPDDPDYHWHKVSDTETEVLHD